MTRLSSAWASRVAAPLRAGLSMEAMLAFLVVACCLGALGHRVAVDRPAPDNVGEILASYAAVASDLPAVGRIGFLSLIANPTTAGATAFLAQNALAPRLLDPNLTAVPFVVTTPRAPKTLDDDPRLTSFDLITASPAGIRISRRRQW